MRDDKVGDKRDSEDIESRDPVHFFTVEPRLHHTIPANTIEVDLDYSNFFIFVSHEEG